MNITEKISYLQDKHYGEWLRVWQDVRDEISDSQSMFCVCGKLATGLHEAGCRRFKNKVNRETVKRLNNLLKV